MLLDNKDTYSKLRHLTNKTSLMMQSEINSFLYQMDFFLRKCYEKLYFLFPEFTRNFYSGIVLGWIRTKTKRYSLYNSVNKNCFRYLEFCYSEDSAQFGNLVDSLKLLRGIHYSLVGSVLNDFISKDAVFFKTKYFVDDIPQGEMQSLVSLFDSCREIQELVEMPFYKTVIAKAIQRSNGNSEYIADNFMEGARGLRKAIWRFDYNNGGTLAGFVNIWIEDELLVNRPHELISTPPGMGCIWEKIKQGLNDGKSLAVSAKAAGVSEEKAKDISVLIHKPPNIRLDCKVEVQKDEEDDSSDRSASEELEKQLQVDFEFTEEESSVLSLLAPSSPLDKKILCLVYGLWDSLDSNSQVSKGAIEKEKKNQKLLT